MIVGESDVAQELHQFVEEAVAEQPVQWEGEAITRLHVEIDEGVNEVDNPASWGVERAEENVRNVLGKAIQQAQSIGEPMVTAQQVETIFSSMEARGRWPFT
ncbi:MAG: hypothetical protein M3280_06510 [Actinomycetota bacterium]|nr:hypothetical protein [Actinomycetota bacterium]